MRPLFSIGARGLLAARQPHIARVCVLSASQMYLSTMVCVFGVVMLAFIPFHWTNWAILGAAIWVPTNILVRAFCLHLSSKCCGRWGCAPAGAARSVPLSVSIWLHPSHGVSVYGCLGRRPLPFP